MSEPLLSVRNLETYYRPITAIRGVSFDVTEGHIVTILPDPRRTRSITPHQRHPLRQLAAAPAGARPARAR